MFPIRSLKPSIRIQSGAPRQRARTGYAFPMEMKPQIQHFRAGENRPHGLLAAASNKSTTQ
jgi:hypothetical protein